MKTVNDLEWEETIGLEYPVAKTDINGLEIIIKKYDDDSFVIVNNSNEKEANLKQVENFLNGDYSIFGEFFMGEKSFTIVNNSLTEPTNNLDAIEATAVEEIIKTDQIPVNVPKSLLKINDKKNWKAVDGVGDKVLDIPHTIHNGCTLRLVKISEDLYKVAVIGLPPNDGDNIKYDEVSLRFAILNYAGAVGVNLSAAEEYFKTLSK